MSYFFTGKGIIGFKRIVDYANRMDNISEIAKHRFKMLEFWDKHGLQATLDAFNISRRSLYNYRKRFKTLGLVGLNDQSKRPHNLRKTCWDNRILNEIKRLRKLLPNLGKEQLQVLLLPFCQELGITCPSASTIGRMIAKAPDKMRHTPMRLDAKGRRKPVRRCKVARRPKRYRPKVAGELVGLDTIERRMGQVKRHIMTYIDESTGYAIALAMDKLTSANAERFFNKAFSLSPFPVSQVITDNGSEFKGKFSKLLDEAEIKHYHTYPNTPKMNAVCERFNRTLQEQFVDYHEDLLFTDLKTFNEKLAEYLFLYNTFRPHKSHRLLTPKQVIINQRKKCNMYWTHTVCCRDLYICYTDGSEFIKLPRILCASLRSKQLQKPIFHIYHCYIEVRCVISTQSMRNIC